jgi:hypothetical protein
MGMIMAGITAVRNAARKTKIKTDITALENGVKAYLNDTGKLPIPDTMQGAAEPSYFAGTAAAGTDVVYRLTTTNNPRAVVYLDAQNNASPGVFLDPWGTPYAFKFDADYNGVLSYPNATAENIPAPVIVVSYGPNKRQDIPAPGDDFISEAWMNKSSGGH